MGQIYGKPALEGYVGLEPTPSAWKAEVLLPLTPISLVATIASVAGPPV